MGRDIDDVASDATWNRDARHETATERLDRPDHTDHDAEVSPRGPHLGAELDRVWGSRSRSLLVSCSDSRPPAGGHDLERVV